MQRHAFHLRSDIKKNSREGGRFRKPRAPPLDCVINKDAKPQRGEIPTKSNPSRKQVNLAPMGLQLFGGTTYPRANTPWAIESHPFGVVARQSSRNTLTV